MQDILLHRVKNEMAHQPVLGTKASWIGSLILTQPWQQDSIHHHTQKDQLNWEQRESCVAHNSV